MKTIQRVKRLANLGTNAIFVDRDLSPAAGASIWDGAPLLAMRQDPSVGICLFEDFVQPVVDDTTGLPTNMVAAGDHKTTAFSKAAGGVLQMNCGDTDNDEFYLQMGAGALHAPFFITDANGKPLWFEIYCKALQHADLGVFVGLAEEGCAAADFLTDNSGVIADKDFIGFNILTASPAAWNVTWKKAGQAVQAIAAAGANADDWHRFGFHFDGLHTITFYVDRVANATVALSSAATFPSGQLMAPIFAVKTGEAVDKAIAIDYVWVAQAR